MRYKSFYNSLIKFIKYLYRQGQQSNASFFFLNGDLNKSFILNKYDLIQCKVYVLLKTKTVTPPTYLCLYVLGGLTFERLWV